MKDLFEELIRYLQDNFIDYVVLDDKDEFLIEIDEKIYQLFEPIKWDSSDEKGIYFDETFCWACDKTEYDFYVYKFGSVWYRLQKGLEEKVKLDPLKWIGKAKLLDDEFYIDIFLGIHGPFEFMNGMGLYDVWCKKAKFLGITSLGICEKGTLAASLKFQMACQKNGLRAIQGLEIEMIEEKKDLKYTVKAFVKNQEGWSNLLHLNSILNVEQREVTKEDLIKCKEGLVLIWDPKTIEYDKIPKELKSCIEYYQLDTVEYEKEDRDVWYLNNLKKFFKSDIEPLIMCDAYCIEKEWYPIRKKLNVLGKLTVHESENQYFKNGQEYFTELSALFKDDQSFYETCFRALDNLKKISFDCNFVIETQIRHMPVYIMTDEEALQYETNVEMFEDLVFKGLEQHPEILEKYSDEVIEERLDREMKIIEDGDVVDYFLMLRDICNWCKKEGILLGSGRGCFLPETKVMTKEGFKEIKDVEIGDIVYGRKGWNSVENKFEYQIEEEIIELELDDGRKIRCTKDHLIWTKNRGYVKAIDLTETDILKDLDED